MKQEDSDTFRGEEKVVLDNMLKSGKGLGAKSESEDELRRSSTLEDYFFNPEGRGRIQVGVGEARSRKKKPSVSVHVAGPRGPAGARQSPSRVLLYVLCFSEL